jgi:hypothetical protein
MLCTTAEIGSHIDYGGYHEAKPWSQESRPRGVKRAVLEDGMKKPSLLTDTSY